MDDEFYGGAAPDDGGSDFELTQELLERSQPLVEGAPPWRYLTETRGLPAAAVRYCATDLRALEPPIPGFDRLAYGVVSLLRESEERRRHGTGRRGLRTGRRARARQGRAHLPPVVSLVPNGVRDALFRSRPSAPRRWSPTWSRAVWRRRSRSRRSSMIRPSTAGARAAASGCAMPPEPTVVVVEDARPGRPTRPRSTTGSWSAAATRCCSPARSCARRPAAVRLLQGYRRSARQAPGRGVARLAHWRGVGRAQPGRARAQSALRSRTRCGAARRSPRSSSSTGCASRADQGVPRSGREVRRRERWPR